MRKAKWSEFQISGTPFGSGQVKVYSPGYIGQY